MDQHRRDNRRYWDQLAQLHVEMPFYKTAPFRRGENILDPLAREGVGDVSGKKLLHLQCHFGLDTLSFARMGAAVTGLDFSPNAIAAARALSEETGVPGTFIEADVLSPPAGLAGFDIVFASWGALCWISDLDAWMRTAAQALKPGGKLVLLEGHPAAMMLDFERDPGAPLMVRDAYDSPEPIVFEEQGSYADPSAVLAEPRCVFWAHGLGPILSAMLKAGFDLRAIREDHRLAWPMPYLVKADAYYWKLPDGAPQIPMSILINAEKCCS